MSRASLTPSAQPVFYGFSFVHHGPHTAFHGLAAALQHSCRVIDATPHSFSWLPRVTAGRLRRKCLVMSEQKLRPYFTGDNRTIHYFFPENTLRKAADWKTRERLVLTLHQPPDEMEAMRKNPHLDGFFRGVACADQIVVQAQSQQPYFQEHYPDIPLACIPLGFATGHYKRKTPYRPPEGGTATILTVGNWMRDYETWARTVAALRGRDRLAFRVIANRDTLDRIRGLFDRNIPDNVSLEFGLSDQALQQAYEEAALFFLPLNDAMANDALLEALSLGVPAIYTDLSATRDYAGEGTATFIPRGEPDAAAQAITDLLADPSRALAYSHLARKRAEEHFDWQHVANAYRTCYAHDLT